MSNILQEIFFAYWFFLPVGLATLGAFFSAKIPYLKKLSYPADFYLKFRGKRVFGSHKTIRGFIIGIICGIITIYIQIFIYEQSAVFRQIMIFDYSLIDPIIFGSLCGLGALVGDAIKSFFKRQNNIAPGKSWFPFDQMDQIIGGIMLTWFYIQLDLSRYILITVVWFLIHPFMTFVGYIFRLRRKPL